MDQYLTLINQALAQDQQVALITVVEISANASKITVGSKLLCLAANQHWGTLGNLALDQAARIEATFHQQRANNDTITLWTDKLQAPANAAFSAAVAQDSSLKVRLAIEILRPQPYLLICGAGHIARALTQLGLIVGFKAIVIDDRAEFAHRNYFPDPRIELKVSDFKTALQATLISASMAVIIVTRGHKHDEACLRLVLDSPAHYIGMIGSHRRVMVVREKLQAEGFNNEQISRIYAPIGLDIGARTPEEIALAILAEVILVRNRGQNVIESSPLRYQRR